jgi:hypothetical protein
MPTECDHGACRLPATKRIRILAQDQAAVREGYYCDGHAHVSWAEGKEPVEIICEELKNGNS